MKSTFKINWLFNMDFFVKVCKRIWRKLESSPRKLLDSATLDGPWPQASTIFNAQWWQWKNRLCGMYWGLHGQILERTMCPHRSPQHWNWPRMVMVFIMVKMICEVITLAVVKASFNASELILKIYNRIAWRKGNTSIIKLLIFLWDAKEWE